MMGGFAQWLAGFVYSLFTRVYNLAIDLMQHVIDALPNFVLYLIHGDGGIFPDPSRAGWGGLTVPTPETFVVSDTYSVFISALNWIFPIGYMIQLSTFVAACVLAYIVVAPLARWFRLLN